MERVIAEGSTVVMKAMGGIGFMPNCVVNVYWILNGYVALIFKDTYVYIYIYIFIFIFFV